MIIGKVKFDPKRTDFDPGIQKHTQASKLLFFLRSKPSYHETVKLVLPIPCLLISTDSQVQDFWPSTYDVEILNQVMVYKIN